MAKAKKELKEITPEQEQVVVEAKDILASKQSVLMRAGQASALNFMKKVADVSELKILKEIKDSKEYKGLVYLNDKKQTTVGSWEEFCKHILKSSKTTIDERLANLNVFGEEFFESSQKMGLGYRDLRALRQLPEDEQTLIIDSQAVESGHKEAVQELIEDLTDKHQKEKKQLNAKLAETTNQLKANREMSDKTAVKLQVVQEQLHAKKFNTEEWQEQVKDFFSAFHKVQRSIFESLDEIRSLNEQLDFMVMDERAKDSATSAFYADNKLIVERVALTWNEIYRTWAHVKESAKPSSEILQELGFEGAGEGKWETMDEYFGDKE